MKKNIFVTGGGGFIGSHLVEKLVTLGHKVKTIVPYNIDNSWGWIDSFPKSIKKNLIPPNGMIACLIYFSVASFYLRNCVQEFSKSIVPWHNSTQRLHL